MSYINCMPTAALISRWIETPLGKMLAVSSDDGIVMFAFDDGADAACAMDRLCKKLQAAGGDSEILPGDHPLLTQLSDEVEQYFSGDLQEFSVKLDPVGSEFERKAWDFLRAIPFAQTRSYGQQARAIGQPNHARVVGRANGRNDIAIVVPCHRVIGTNGTLTGYGGGLARKRWLLDYERRVAGIADQLWAD